MRTLAVVPVKSFDVAKQRLAGALGRDAREVLARAMLADVLAGLRATRAVDEIAVVTDDAAARTLAREAATVLRDDARSGQSAAAEIGIRHAVANGFERVVLVPGDTPMVDAGELDRLLARVEADRLAIAIVADRHDTGTNALVLAPPDALRPSFGPGSRARHAAAAEATGLPHRLEDAPSLAHDVDTPGDLRALVSALEAAPAAAQQTRHAIAELDRSGALRALAGSTEAVPQG